MHEPPRRPRFDLCVSRRKDEKFSFTRRRYYQTKNNTFREETPILFKIHDGGLSRLRVQRLL
jgi:hypothetical protein